MNVWQLFSISMPCTHVIFLQMLHFSWIAFCLSLVFFYFNRTDFVFRFSSSFFLTLSIQISSSFTFDYKFQGKFLNCCVNVLVSWFNSHSHSHVSSNKFLLWPLVLYMYISTGFAFSHECFSMIFLFNFFPWIRHMTPIWTEWRAPLRCSPY